MSERSPGSIQRDPQPPIPDRRGAAPVLLGWTEVPGLAR